MSHVITLNYVWAQLHGQGLGLEIQRLINLMMIINNHRQAEMLQLLTTVVSRHSLHGLYILGTILILHSVANYGHAPKYDKSCNLLSFIVP